jgi:hypothetical protein
VLRAFVTRVTALVGATHGHVSTWDRERDLLLIVTDYRVAGGVSGEVDPYVASEYPASVAVLESQHPLQLRASDPDADPSEVALLHEFGFRSLRMLPLVSRGETIGLVEITDVRDRVLPPTRSSFAARSPTSSPRRCTTLSSTSARASSRCVTA